MLSKLCESRRAISLILLVLPAVVYAQVQGSSQAFSSQKPSNGAETSKALIYREASKPITIGEMSEMQAAAMRTAFLERMGYTKTPPPPPPPKVKAEKPIVLWTFKPTAIWGPIDMLSAEALVDGQLTLIRAGQSLLRSENTNIVVKAISPNSLVLSVTSQTTQATQASKKSKKSTTGTTVSTERHHAIRVGQQLEQAL